MIIIIIIMRTGKNLWPMARNVVAGDGPDAWELATGGKVSHGMVLKSKTGLVYEDPSGAVSIKQ
eukprot:SAG31_NODE_627_length_13445_cov_18.311053_9_plen_64_part_00